MAGRLRYACGYFAGLLALVAAGPLAAAETAPPAAVKVIDGVVMPRRPVATAIIDAMHFLKKADGDYVPGLTNGDLAGYFTSAFVNSNGTRSLSQLCYPARQHAYFIRAFLRYYAYSGEREWLLRACDLADWNIARSTPANAVYPNLPYSTFQNGKPTGFRDKNCIEPDKAAFLSSSYLAVYESTAETRYLDAARKAADALVARQREDGSWPFRVVPEDGIIYQDLGGAPVFFAEFFERILRHDDKPAYHRAREKAVRYLIATNVEKEWWGTYHEDILPRPASHISAEPMSFTAGYLFRSAQAHPEYIELGRRVLRQMEAKLVHTTGHAAAPAPAVAEQTTLVRIMPGHTARYCWALSDLYLATHDADVKRRALSGLNAVTYMQAETGLFRTHFYDVTRKTDVGLKAPDWYSQHLYSVCHLLESMAAFPEMVPEGQNHLLASSTALRDVRYAPGSVRYATLLPSQVVMKVSFVPKTVRVGASLLPVAGHRAAGNSWSFDEATHVLTVRHAAGEVSVGQ